MTQKLKLHSPVGAEPLIFKWPIATSEGKDGPEEIVDTIRLVCEDFPELLTPFATRILKQGEDVSEYDYEQTKSLCERYNKAIDSLRQLIKGSPRQKVLNKKPSRNQLKHILHQCYNQSVKDPEKLNQYEPFSPEVYGETSFELVEQMIKSVQFSESDYFIDLGSGVGQVVLQVSAATNCKFCYGIEKAEWPAEYAVAMEKEFKKWLRWFGKQHGNYLIEKGDFLEDSVKDKLNKATIVFVNNFAFGPKVDHELKQRFANCLKEGARIVSSKAFCPLNFRITERNLSDIGTIMQVEELSPLCGAVSWTGKPFAYYVHTIDRTLLEKYFQRLRNPNKKDEVVEPRKDRKGRPVMSVKDKINGALSAGSDSASTTTGSTSRWRRIKGHDGDRASPSLQSLSLTSSAIKMLDFDSCSNSSQASSSYPSSVVGGGGTQAVTNGSSHSLVVFGPTTRRQWNEYVARPRAPSQSCTENDDSSAGDVTQEKKKEIGKALQRKKKRLQTVKRLNNGMLGKRQLQQKQSHKSKKSDSPQSDTKPGFRLRSRRKSQKLSQSAAEVGETPKSGVVSTSSTAAVRMGGNSHPHQANVASQPPSLDSLNLLHAHTVMSTSGKTTEDSVHYNDRRMAEASNSYFKPTVQSQTVPMLEKQAGFLNMIENMKQGFLSFMTFMQTPQYRAMLQLQVEQEKAKNAELKAKREGLENGISKLQKDGVGLMKERLKEMGLKADSYSELLDKAQSLVASNKQLHARAASLEAHVHSLQAEQSEKIAKHKKAHGRKRPTVPSKNGMNLTDTAGDGSAARKQDLRQKALIAGLNRLDSELQQLQEVNRSYTNQKLTGGGVSTAITTPVSTVKLENPTSTEHSYNINSSALREKLNIKENYETLGKVLSTLKKDISSNQRHISQPPQFVKIEPKLEQLSPLFTSSSSISSQSSMPSQPSAAVTTQKLHQTPNKCLSSSSTTNSHKKIYMCDTPKLDGVPTSATTNVTTLALNVSSAQCTVSVASSATVSPASNSTSVTSVSHSTPVSVSSWTTQPKSSEAKSKSPRILPPGTKIDIKKPSKHSLNGFKSPNSLATSKTNNGKSAASLAAIHMNGLTITGANSSQKVPTSRVGSVNLVNGAYTDNEKSAAEDLISLMTSPTPRQQLTQHLAVQQDVHKQHLILNNSFVVNPVPIKKAAPKKPKAISKKPTILPNRKDNRSTNLNFLDHRSGGNRSKPGLGSADQPILITDLNQSPKPGINVEPSHHVVHPPKSVIDLNRQHYMQDGKPADSLLTNFITGIHHHNKHSSSTPNTVFVTNSSSNGERRNFKHKSLEPTAIGPSPPKFINLEQKSDVQKQIASYLANQQSAASANIKQQGALKHLLESPTITTVNHIGVPQPATLATINHVVTPLTTPTTTINRGRAQLQTKVSNAEILPYVTFQPSSNAAITSTTATLNGAVQPPLIQLLQQRLVVPKQDQTTSLGLPDPAGVHPIPTILAKPARGGTLSAVAPIPPQSSLEHAVKPSNTAEPNKDWWIVVMQNNQAGNAAVTPYAQLGASVLNGHSK